MSFSIDFGQGASVHVDGNGGQMASYTATLSDGKVVEMRQTHRGITYRKESGISKGDYRNMKHKLAVAWARTELAKRKNKA